MSTDTLFKDTTGCARCGGAHPVMYKPFRRPLPDADGDFTHWGTCPVTGDPILMRIGSGQRMPTGRVIVMAYQLDAEGDTEDAWTALTTDQTRNLVRRKPSTIVPVGDDVWIAYDGLEL